MEDEDRTTESWEELKERGNAAFRSSLYEHAVEYYSGAIRLRGGEPVLHSNRAAALIQCGRSAEAVKDAEEAIRLDPAFLKGYHRLHSALCSLGRFSEASRVMSRAKEGFDDKSDADSIVEMLKKSEDALRSIEEARRLIELNQHSQAERTLANTYSSFPDCAQIAFLFAEARAPREPDEVIRSLIGYNRTHDSDPHFLFVRALAMYYRGVDGFKNASLILRQALDMDPDFTKAALLLKKIRTIEACRENGNEAFRQKRFKEAAEFYTQAIDIDGSNRRMTAMFRGNRSASRLELKDLQGALMDCEFSIKNGNDGAKMYARRSRIYESMDKLDDAMRDMQQACELDGNYQQELHQLKVRVKRSKRKDYYKILGITQQEADEHSIKRAYKKSALQWHPDKWAHSSEEDQQLAESKFKEVGEAFAVLSDPKKKMMYDNGQLDDNVEGSGGNSFAGGEDMMQMFNMMFEGMGGMPMGGGHGMRGRRGGRGQQFPGGFSFSFQ
jgi:DnaJ family protein C protein 7